MKKLINKIKEFFFPTIHSYTPYTPTDEEKEMAHLIVKDFAKVGFWCKWQRKLLYDSEMKVWEKYEEKK